METPLRVRKVEEERERAQRVWVGCRRGSVSQFPSDYHSFGGYAYPTTSVW